MYMYTIAELIDVHGVEVALRNSTTSMYIRIAELIYRCTWGRGGSKEPPCTCTQIHALQSTVPKVMVCVYSRSVTPCLVLSPMVYTLRRRGQRSLTIVCVLWHTYTEVKGSKVAHYSVCSLAHTLRRRGQRSLTIVCVLWHFMQSKKAGGGLGRRLKHCHHRNIHSRVGGFPRFSPQEVLNHLMTNSHPKPTKPSEN